VQASGTISSHSRSRPGGPPLLQVVAEPRHEQRRAGAHAEVDMTPQRAATGRRRGPRVERLVERPAGQPLDDRAGAAEVDLALLQGQIEAAENGSSRPMAWRKRPRRLG
jgi:hypothetical protein